MGNFISMENFTSIFTIFAIFAGPIIAVLITLIWEKARRKREEQMTILTSLLNTLGRPADPQYTFAIRQIPIVFHSNKRVIAAHTSFYEATNVNVSESATQNQIDEMARRHRLLVTEVVKALKFKNITADSLSNYTPVGLGNREQLLSEALLAIIKISEHSETSAMASEKIAAIALKNNT